MEEVKSQLRPEGQECVRQAKAQDRVFQVEKDYAKRAKSRHIMGQLENYKQPSVIRGRVRERRLAG